MSKKVKFIIAITSIVVALTAGTVLVCVFGLKNEEPATPPETPKVVGLIDNGTKENLNLSFVADGDSFKDQKVQKVYEFKIENTDANNVVLTLSSEYVVDNMAVSYYYSSEQVSDYQSLEGGEFKNQKIASGSSCYLYVIVRVQDTTKNGSCTGKTELDTSDVVYLTFKSDNFDDEVVELDENNKLATSKIPSLPSGVLGRSYVGWYLDSTFENQADLTKSFNADTTIYSKWEYVESDWISYSSYSDSYEVVKGTGELPAHLIIPEKYNDGTNGEKEITKIDFSYEAGGSAFHYGAFYGNDSLVSVSIPGTIKSLYSGTFWGTYSLESVYISKGVTSIKSGFAEVCNKLKYVYVEDVTTWTSSKIGEIDVEVMQDPEQCAHIVKGYSLTYTDETDTMVKLNANGGVFASISSGTQYSDKVTSSTVLDELENLTEGLLFTRSGDYWEYTGEAYNHCPVGKISFSAKAGDKVIIDLSSLNGKSVDYYFGNLNVEFTGTRPTEGVYMSGYGINGETTQRVVYEITEDGNYFFCVTVVTYGNMVELIKFKVQVNSYGEDQSVVEMTKTEGQEMGALETPTREGYRFAGWFTEAEGGELITASTAVNQPITYYAHWEEE